VDTLVYLIYGSRREYQLELTYSVLSAAHFASRGGANLRIVLITDEANRRPDLRVENVVFSAAEFANWTQNGQYRFAAKIHVVRKALDLFGGKVALIDTDTYFKVDPRWLFAKIGPGRAVMHAYEGMLGEDLYLGPILQKISAEPTLSYPVGPTTRLFNSGVIGLDYRDRELLQDVLLLCAELYRIYPAFTTEQFAFSIVLHSRTFLSDCAELITHYYGYRRGFIHTQLDALFPHFTPEAFQRYVRALPALAGFPPKRKLDQIRARLKAMVRREGPEYRFAYLAYLSALSSARASPVHANIWARINVAVLRHNEFPIESIEQDFGVMKSPQELGWPSSETQDAWRLFWRELAHARGRGQLRATASSLIVDSDARLKLGAST
jgi:hypothetical protein